MPEQKNVGWRLDYFLVDKLIETNITNSEIHDQIQGSDHCPLSLDLDI